MSRKIWNLEFRVGLALKRRKTGLLAAHRPCSRANRSTMFSSEPPLGRRFGRVFESLSPPALPLDVLSTDQRRARNAGPHRRAGVERAPPSMESGDLRYQDPKGAIATARAKARGHRWRPARSDRGRRCPLSGGGAALARCLPPTEGNIHPAFCRRVESYADQTTRARMRTRTQSTRVFCAVQRAGVSTPRGRMPAGPPTRRPATIFGSGPITLRYRYNGSSRSRGHADRTSSHRAALAGAHGARHQRPCRSGVATAIAIPD